METDTPVSVSTMWPTETQRLVYELTFAHPRGIFGTGIENSDPVVPTPSGAVRRDQLKEAFDFYANWRERLARVKNLGVKWVRFGQGYSRVHTAPGRFDFSFTDQVLACAKEFGLIVIYDALHFGLPDWLHADCPDAYFQNTAFPEQFARYIEAVALRYPQITHFTLVNEPFVTAIFSARLGWWNECRTDDRSFVRAAANIARAAILGRHAIERVWLKERRPGIPTFLQNDSFEHTFVEAGCDPQDAAEALLHNVRRFAGLDLIFGHRDAVLRDFLLANGMSEAEYDWCMANGSKKCAVLGIDHYIPCIRTMTKDGLRIHTSDDPSRLKDVVRTYWERYRMPLLHMETNFSDPGSVESVDLLYRELVELREEDIPILGMTIFGDEIQVDWKTCLREVAGTVNSDGLFYCGELRPMGRRFGELAREGFPPHSFQ
jgi:hypothetical protein